MVTWIVQGSYPLSSGSSGMYFCRHFGRHVSLAVVTLVVTQDLPHYQLQSLVILVMMAIVLIIVLQKAVHI